MKWITKPTIVRRFKTMRTVSIKRLNNGQWNIYFFHNRHEVHIGMYYKAYLDVDESKVNKVLFTACKNGIVPHIVSWYDSMSIFLTKPI